MEMNFSDADISSFYKMLIELGGAQTVDDTPDKYIRKKDDNTIAYCTGTDGTTKNLAIYGTVASDVLIINPLAEGDAESATNSWFMSSCNIVLAANIANVIRVILKTGADSHKKSNKKEEETEVDLKVIKYLGKDAIDVDDKMCKEFENICKPITNFFNVHYNRTQQQGEVKCPIFTLAQRKSMPKIRVKTWEVLEHILGRMLKTEDLSDFNYKPGTVGVPAFESFANIVVKLYEILAEPLEIIGIKVEHIAELQSHLKYLPQYYAKAKWCVTPQGSANSNTNPASKISGFTPWSVNHQNVANQAPTSFQISAVPMSMPVAQPAPNFGGMQPQMSNYPQQPTMSYPYAGMPCVPFTY